MTLGTGTGQAEPGPRPKSEKPTLVAMARNALQDYDGDVEKTTNHILKTIRKNKDLLAIIVNEAVEIAVSYQVALAHRGERRVIMRTLNHLEALSGAVESMLLDFPLAGGIKLRDATRDDVERQAAIYRSQIGDMAHKQRWLEAIAERLPEDSTVGDVFSETDVASLWDNTNAQ